MSDWPDWAEQVFSEHRIIPTKLSNLSHIRRSVIGLNALASNPSSVKTAQDLLLKQPDVAKYLDRQKTDPELVAALVAEISETETQSKHENGSINGYNVEPGAPQSLALISSQNQDDAMNANQGMTNKIPEKLKSNVLSSLAGLVNLIKKNENQSNGPNPKRIKREPKEEDAISTTVSIKKEPVDVNVEPVENVNGKMEEEEKRLEIEKPALPSFVNVPMPNFTGNEEVVCFGMIKTQMVGVQYSILHSCLQNLASIEVDVVAEPTATEKLYALRIDSMDQRKIGYAEKKISCVLSPLLQRVRVDGLIPKPATISAAPQLCLILSGFRNIIHHLGQFLSSQGVYLTHPVVPMPFMYMNPHAGLIAQKQEYIQVGQTTKSVDEVKNQIDSIYKTLISAEDLPEMDPDSRLTTSLYTHQKQALHFMMQCEHPEDNNGGGLWKKHLNGSFENLITGESVKGKPTFHKGGILADDMGLGKTIEVISLILKTYNESNDWLQNVKLLELNQEESLGYDRGLIPAKGTLIICPLSTVSNWEDQIQNHVRRGALSIYVYHGASRCQDPRVLSKFNVILTTYNVVSLEYGRDLKNFKKSCAENKHNPKVPVSMMTSILHKLRWFRVVLDEAHIIKDTNTGQSKAVCALSAERKWGLTGTPIQNKLDDIYSLVNFLNIEPFCSKIAWTNYITKAMRMKTPNGGNIGIARLQTLMKSVTLRRTKQSKINGKPILTLPPRHDIIHYLTLDHTEQTLYDRASAQAQKVFEGFEQEGSVLRHYVHLLELILKLRQICTHPLLCKNYEELLREDSSAVKWNLDRAAHLLSLLKDSGDEDCCFCGIYVDGIEFSPYISRCGHIYCETCVKSTFSKGTTLTCGMCQTQLHKSDIILVAEGEEDSSNKKQAETGLAKLQSGNVQSSKVTSLLEDLARAKQDAADNGEPPVKSIIFSQWTQMLDLLERPLMKTGHRIVRLDGRMSRPERTLSLDRFKKDSSVTIMLVSLKAGGVGLNLTSASRVYIMEPYWNPAIEQQAVDRVHRMGQTRPVYTVRFICSGTIEDSILELQRKKLALTQMTFKEEEQVDLAAIDRSKKMKRADLKKDKQAQQNERMDDLRLLFNLRNPHK